MGRSRCRSGWRCLALWTLLVAAVPAAWAGSQSSSFGVGLTITESCSVDSSPVVEARSAATLGRPRAACDFGARVAVDVGREAPALPAGAGEEAQGLPGDPVVVVTLTF